MFLGFGVFGGLLGLWVLGFWVFSGGCLGSFGALRI